MSDGRIGIQNSVPISISYSPRGIDQSVDLESASLGTNPGCITSGKFLRLGSHKAEPGQDSSIFDLLRKCSWEKKGMKEAGERWQMDLNKDATPARVLQLTLQVALDKKWCHRVSSTL